jgi:hypothetical protein
MNLFAIGSLSPNIKAGSFYLKNILSITLTEPPVIQHIIAEYSNFGSKINGVKSVDEVLL